MGCFCLERERKARECGQGGTYKEKGKAGKLRTRSLGRVDLGGLVRRRRTGRATV